MDIRGRCPSCQAKFKVGAKYAGKTLPCPKCHAPIDVPQENHEASSVETPPLAEPPPLPPVVTEDQAQPAALQPLAKFTINAQGNQPTAARRSRQVGLRRRWSRSLVVGGAVAAGLVLSAALTAIFWQASAAQSPPRANAVAFKAQGQEKTALPLTAETNPSAEPVTIKSSPSKREPRIATATASREPPQPAAASMASIPGFDGWLQSLMLAKRQASDEKKDILLVFGCSDGEPATQRLARALKQPEAAKAVAELVPVIIDFPRTRAGYELVEDDVQNRQLYEEFALQRLPALALADSEGRFYCLTQKLDDFEKLPSQLALWRGLKSERDALLAAARAGSDEERLAAAGKAIDWLRNHELWMVYRDEMAQWLKLAQQVDPDNKQAILETFFEPYWFLQATSISARDGDTAQQIAAELDPWVRRKFQDADRGAKLHLVAARLLQSARRFDDGFRQMEHAAAYHPLDGALVEALRDARQILEHRDLLGSGTGFLVSSAGYVLTNAHVVEGEGQIVIRIPGVKETVVAELVARDANQDIALLKVTLPGADKHKPLPLASGSVRRGSSVAGFGYPLGDTLGTGLKLSAGTISAVPDESNKRYLLDLTVNPGNSGGPLCDRHANVVGMISEKTGSEGLADSYGLAIPAMELIKFLVEHLPASAKRPAPDAAGLDLGWDKVDERVSSGVLMIVVKKK